MNVRKSVSGGALADLRIRRRSSLGETGACGTANMA
jgi:hypothetical protein